MILREESASNTPKFIAPPKQSIFESCLLFAPKISCKNFLGRRKIKCQESSETRLVKFRADRSHPRGVHGPFKIFAF